MTADICISVDWVENNNKKKKKKKKEKKRPTDPFFSRHVTVNTSILLIWP